VIDISGFQAAKAAAGQRIQEARERIEADAKELRAELRREREAEKDERVIRVAKAICEAGFREWPLTGGSVSDYNIHNEQRYWLRLAVAAIGEIEK